MVNYADGKIYTVKSGDEVLYVGSTTLPLRRRWNHHERRAPGREISLYEDFPCSNKFELRSREEEVRRLLEPSLNQVACCSGINTEGLSKLEYDKLYRIANRSRRLEQKKNQYLRRKVPYTHSQRIQRIY